jgi:hypothetical protein
LLNEDNPDNHSHLRLGSRTPIEVPDEPEAHRFFRAANLELRLRLEVDDVEPIATDVPRGDRTERSQPLLYNEKRNGGADETPVTPVGRSRFILDVREDISGLRDWHMTAILLETIQEESKAGHFVLLSAEPFSVSRFYSQPLDARGDQGTIIVASYDSDTRMWELKQVSRLYHYVLPPQSIGESMDKPRRLEIHDVREDHTDGDGDRGFYRPYPVAEKGIPETPRPLDLRHRVVEFRLTPSAEIWIKPSDVERGFFLPEWASHEIFRQRSELGLGAALDAFRGEFLYGLPVGIATAKETGPVTTRPRSGN